MKILQIIYSLCSGGAERFVVDLSNNLSQNPDDEIILLVVNSLDDSKAAHYLPDVNKKVKVRSVNGKGLTPSSLFGIYKAIKYEKPDIVHLHSNMILIYLPILLGVRTKFVHTLHSLAPKCLAFGFCKPINRILYKNTVQAITISQECHESFFALYGASYDILVTNGRARIETTDALPVVRKELGTLLKPGAPVFINVARFHPAKNHAVLFEAFERLTSEGLDCQLVVLGSHHEENAEKYRNHPNIHIIGERRNVADYLSCADFFILSSSYEGLPLTLLEAMSVGCIPVCTPAGGIKNVIRNAENGYIAKGFESEDLYASVKEALLYASTINSKSIISEYENNYSMKTCVEKYFDIYKKI